MARRGVSRLGSMSSPAKEWRGHKPPRASCSLTPFPHHLTTPSPKSTSCQERDLLKPAWWRLQLQKRCIFIQTLFPVCRLRGLICWCSVLSLLIQTVSPVASEQRCLSPSKDAARHQAHLPQDCQVLGLSPPAALPPVTSRSPSSACSGAETRVAGWARVGVGGWQQEHFCCRRWKNPLSYWEELAGPGGEWVCRFSRASRIHCS